MLAIAAMGESSSSPPQLPPAEGAALKHREPTPDHPPYSWMIGEAIAELGAGDGSAEEAAISDFIRARHPGVPAAHDRFFRHYLAKHVAEGLFVCTAAGRYSLPLDEDEEPVLALADAPAPATESKRGRGRPRKDDSAPTPKPAAGNKGRTSSPSAPPKRRGRPPKDRSAVAAAGSAASPATEGKRGPGRPRKDGSTPAGKKKGSSGSPSSTTPKRGRGRPRLVPRAAAATDVVSGEALVTDMEEGGDATSTTDNNREQPQELALVAVTDGLTTLSIREEDGGEAPSAKLPLLAKGSTQPCDLALVAAYEGSASAVAADKEDYTQGPLEDSAPALVADKEDSTQAPSEVSAPALVADRQDGTQAPSEGSAPALVADKEDGTQAPSEGPTPPLVADMENGIQAPSEGSAPPLVADKVDGTQAPSEASASQLVADKEDGTQAPSGACAPALVANKDDGTQASREGSALVLVSDKEHGTQATLEGSPPPLVDDGTKTPIEGSAPALVTSNDYFTEPMFTKHKRCPRTCRSAPAKTTHAPAWTSIVQNIAGSKALSAPPKGHGRQCKPASAAVGEVGPRRPVAIKPRKMILLNADRTVQIKPRKMLLLNADNVPDHPGFCVLALPAPVPTAAKA